MRTDELINALVEDQVATAWTLERSVGLAIVVGSVLAGAIFFLAIGFRPDIAQALATLRFPFKFVVTLSLAIAATFYASNCPDDSGLFVATWYPLATGIVVLAGYLIGSRSLKW